MVEAVGIAMYKRANRGAVVVVVAIWLSACSGTNPVAPRERLQTLAVARENFEITETRADACEQGLLGSGRPLRQLIERPAPLLARRDQAGAPKHVLNVICGSMPRPISVPAILLV